MKLYYSPGACSLAPHIALSEAGLAYDAVKVDLRKHELADGTDYYTINPKGYVPLLELDDGQRLSEVAGDPAVHRRPQARHARAGVRHDGALSRDGVAQLHRDRTAQAVRSAVVSGHARCDAAKSSAPRWRSASTIVSKTLTEQPYLTGEAFTIADAYLFTILNWAGMLKVDLSPWPALQQFQARVAARPQVHAALVAEGLAKAEPVPPERSVATVRAPTFGPARGHVNRIIGE